MRDFIGTALLLLMLAGCHFDEEIEGMPLAPDTAPDAALDATPDAAPDTAPDTAAPCALGTTERCDIAGCPGTRHCIGGVFGECTPPPETCNGADDDCDGTLDEGFGVGEPCTVGEGACAAEGTTACTTAGDAVECPATPGAPAAESCNGVDDDCDGTSDEAIEPAPCETGQPGVCAAGNTACVDGATVCQPPTGPSEEICDGLDNDCDGSTDEADDGAPLTEPCYDGPDGTVDVGSCLGGTATCVDGAFAACQDQVLPEAETCNDLDDDCNGTTDDIDFGVCICRPGSEALCYTGPEGTEGTGPCRGGTWTCADDGTAYGPCVGEVGPAPETCNGLDDDCDGVVDEEIAPVACYDGPRQTRGVGSCRDGLTRCVDGALACVGAVLPEADRCDGVDRDCDGGFPPVELRFDEQRYDTPFILGETVAADLDDDGDLDLVAANASGSVFLRSSGGAWYANDGQGRFGPANTLADTMITTYPVIAVGELTGNNRLDLVLQNRGGLVIYPNVIAGRDPLPLAAGLPQEAGRGLVMADLHGDGPLDVAFSGLTRADGLGLYTARGDGAGAFEPAVRIADLPHSASDILVRDLDGDGALDLLVVTALGGGIHWVRGLAGRPALLGPGPVTDSYIRAVLRDLDGDGRDDLAFEASDGVLARALFEQGPALGDTRRLDFGRSLLAIRAGQFDCDPAPELVVSSLSGTWIIGDPVALEGITELEGGSSSRSLAVADLDGDGLDDIVQQGGGDGRLLVRLQRR